MRQIKYRAWNAEKGEMICPIAVSMSGRPMVENNPLEDKHGSVTINKPDGTSLTYYADWATYQCFDYPLMQFTGLLDKNGKEIFEGDVVKGVSRDPRKRYIGMIYFDKVYGAWCMSGYDGDFFHTHRFQYCAPLGECRFNIEVIGNIHENPEILKEGE